MRSTFLTALSALATALVAVLLPACPGTLEQPERFDNLAGEVDIVTAPVDGSAPVDGCGSIETDIFGKRCATSDCHSGRAPSASLDLSPPNLFSRLANRAASTGATLLKPGDPNASVIYQKLSPTPPFLERMPIGDPLDDTAIDCVRRWIEVNR